MNATYKENFIKVKRFIMIKAEKDTMVYPNEGEWWGHFADGDLKTVPTGRRTPAQPMPCCRRSLPSPSLFTRPLHSLPLRLPDAGIVSQVVPMKETKWYKDDLFGLRTVDEAGKIFFNSTTGNHLQFTQEQLVGLVQQYFI